MRWKKSKAQMYVSTGVELDAEQQSRRFVSLVPNMVISIFFPIFFARNILVQATFALFASKQNGRSNGSSSSTCSAGWKAGSPLDVQLHGNRELAPPCASRSGSGPLAIKCSPASAVAAGGGDMQLAGCALNPASLFVL